MVNGRPRMAASGPGTRTSPRHACREDVPRYCTACDAESALEIVQIVRMRPGSRPRLVERFLNQVRLHPRRTYGVVSYFHGTTSYGEKRAGPAYRSDTSAVGPHGNGRAHPRLSSVTRLEIGRPVHFNRYGNKSARRKCHEIAAWRRAPDSAMSRRPARFRCTAATSEARMPLRSGERCRIRAGSDTEERRVFHTDVACIQQPGTPIAIRARLLAVSEPEHVDAVEEHTREHVGESEELPAEEELRLTVAAGPLR